MGADISHGRALDGCMDDNCLTDAWTITGGGGGQDQGTGYQLPPHPLESPMVFNLSRVGLGKDCASLK